MNLEEIRRILELVREHALSEFELEEGTFKLRIRKNGTMAAAGSGADHGYGRAPAAEASVPAAALQPASPAAAEPTDPADELAIVKSPIVGTFYRAAEPTSPPFADIGQEVKKGQVLCIIEAMKLMNEIESEYDGVLVAAYVENGQPVQYGERLFAIRTK